MNGFPEVVHIFMYSPINCWEHSGAKVVCVTLHCPGKVEDSLRPRQELNHAPDAAQWLSKPRPQHPSLWSLSSPVTINPPQTNRNPICSNK